MSLEEQREIFAQRIKGLGRFRFLFRPALAEGHIGSAVLPLSIRDLDRDKATGDYQFPDSHLMARVRAALAKQSGIPLARLLQEQEKRLPPALPETGWRRFPPQPRLTRPQYRTQRITQPTPSTDGGADTANVPQPAQPLPIRRREPVS
jgi:hypothetical protein